MEPKVNNKEKTLEDFKTILSLAKLNSENLKSVSQALYFTPNNLQEHNYKLLQLDSHLLEEITEGSKLFFKGEKDEDVVLCSDTHTFQILEAETSNSLLLTNGLKFNEDIGNGLDCEINKITVKAIFHEYLEATLSKPHLKKMDELLKNSLYRGPEYEYEINSEHLLTFEELCDKVQASKKEIKDALYSMSVIEINGKVRLLDLEYHFRVLSYMLKLIDEKSWDLDEIDFGETLDSLQDLVPKNILSKVFDKYAEESKEIDGIPLYRYKSEEICKFFAQVLLHETGKFNLEEFLQAWKESVPEGMIPNEEMLYGIAIIDRISKPNVIWAFDESDLL